MEVIIQAGKMTKGTEFKAAAYIQEAVNGLHWLGAENLEATGSFSDLGTTDFAKNAREGGLTFVNEKTSDIDTDTDTDTGEKTAIEGEPTTTTEPTSTEPAPQADETEKADG